MKSRAEEAIRRLIEQGHVMSKNDAAALVFCDHRTAQRVFSKLHAEKIVYIAAWEPVYRQTIPVFKKGPGKDKAKPKPLSDKLRKRRLRKENPEFCMQEALKKRQKRFLEKQQKLGVQAYELQIETTQ